MNYVSPTQKIKIQNRQERRLEYWISMRALSVLLSAVVVGSLLGSFAVGVLVGVVAVIIMIVLKFYQETNYILKNPRG